MAPVLVPPDEGERPLMQRADRVNWLSFTPSRVDGLDGVTTVVVPGDRLHLQVGSDGHVLHFSKLAPAPTGWGRLRRVFQRVPLIVGERDWFRAPQDRFFRFYATPALTIYMPVGDPQGYGESTFGRLRAAMLARGFDTVDLG